MELAKLGVAVTGVGLCLMAFPHFWGHYRWVFYQDTQWGPVCDESRLHLRAVSSSGLRGTSGLDR